MPPDDLDELKEKAIDMRNDISLFLLKSQYTKYPIGLVLLNMAISAMIAEGSPIEHIRNLVDKNIDDMKKYVDGITDD